MGRLRWRRAALALLTVLVLLLVQEEAWACGPGRGGGRRRAARKLRPLVFKQHVPNVSERTLGASGLSEGPVAREDPRFGALVPNYNPDIVFRDDEGTGADRLMTERCREKLDTLAISVMNQWPGVKLRVTEAWDDQDQHRPNSLHYEGRAVDVTTSDKDRSKYGMLARLAREAGFDWVYYESRSHIHCSVKSESSAASRLGGCFPGGAEVLTPRGPAPLSSVSPGDEVRVMRADGSLAFSPVLMFLHREPDAAAAFLTLTTSANTSLTLTPTHLVLAVRRGRRRPRAVMASRVGVGDRLLVASGGALRAEAVVGVASRAVGAAGVYAPLTPEGTVVVDGHVASCYARVASHAHAHWAFLPVRASWALLGALGLDAHDAHDDARQPIHWYPRMLYALASWLLPSCLAS